jgi:hypothetical protein
MTYTFTSLSNVRPINGAPTAPPSKAMKPQPEVKRGKKPWPTSIPSYL